ncbi:MAG: hypothetical protein VR67_18280 [Peptococcaceae bacterium BRH_c8a]|nr:MAG: hypothetical protein VR67_18280 [Peptococcaceae bacterium BRH_c8a]
MIIIVKFYGLCYNFCGQSIAFFRRNEEVEKQNTSGSFQGLALFVKKLFNYWGKEEGLIKWRI